MKYLHKPLCIHPVTKYRHPRRAKGTRLHFTLKISTVFCQLFQLLSDMNFSEKQDKGNRMPAGLLCLHLKEIHSSWKKKRSAQFCIFHIQRRGAEETHLSWKMWSGAWPAAANFPHLPVLRRVEQPCRETRNPLRGNAHLKMVASDDGRRAADLMLDLLLKGVRVKRREMIHGFWRGGRGSRQFKIKTNGNCHNAGKWSVPCTYVVCVRFAD